MTADERELIRFMEWDEGRPMTAQEINLVAGAGEGDPRRRFARMMSGFNVRFAGGGRADIHTPEQ
jgi:hypothetical protein